MRVIGYIEHPYFKVSVFQNGNRFSVKFEDGPVELTFKFDDGQGVESLGDVKKLADELFLEKIAVQIKEMKNSRSEVLGRFLQSEEESEFEEII